MIIGLFRVLVLLRLMDWMVWIFSRWIYVLAGRLLFLAWLICKVPAVIRMVRGGMLVLPIVMPMFLLNIIYFYIKYWFYADLGVVINGQTWEMRYKRAAKIHICCLTIQLTTCRNVNTYTVYRTVYWQYYVILLL